MRHLLTLDFSNLKAYVAAYALNPYAANAYEGLRKALGVRSVASGVAGRNGSTPASRR